MALGYTGEQEQIRREARRALEAAFKPEANRTLLHRRGQFDQEFWNTCIDMGWTAAGAPERHGGLGLGPLDVCIIAEECGRFVGAAPFLAANYAAIVALTDHASETQQAELVARIASGESRFCLAFAEDEDGLPSPAATALANGILNGRKAAVVGAAAATHAIVLAESGLGVIDLTAEGVRREVGETIDNTRCSADLIFENVPATALNATPTNALRLLAIQAVVTAFEQIGGAEAAMSRAQAYANTREAFGQLIGKFQAIKHRIAEMYVAIELARGNALLAATGLAEDAADFIQRAGAARLAASDAFEFAAAQSMQTHGAIGVTWEHDLHLYLRRARAQAVELGSPLFWEDVIVDALQDVHL